MVLYPLGCNQHQRTGTMPWGLVAGLAGSAISGIFGDRAADRQSDAALEGQRIATEEQRRQYDQTRRDLGPYRGAGEAAVGNLMDPEGNFRESFDYGFRRSEGMRGLNNQYAVRGGGGNAMRALVEFNQNLADAEYGDWWNRQYSMAGMGANAAAQTGQAGMNMANQIGANAMNTARTIGNAQAGAQLNWGNAANRGIENAMYAWQNRGGGGDQLATLDQALWAPKTRTVQF